MSEFKFACPHCRQHLQCDSKFCGRQIQCPGCNHLIRIPDSPTVVAQGGATPESGLTWATFVPPAEAPPAEGLPIKKKKNEAG